MKAITPANYSKRVHCVQCGGVFPTNKTEVLASDKTVLRLCFQCYEPKRKSTEAAIFAKQEKVREVQKEAAENIKNRSQ